MPKPDPNDAALDPFQDSPDDNCVPVALDPLPIFHAWFAEAEASEPHNANAMALATATPDGRPSVRMVLLKRADHRGFAFYTNTDSRKGRELEINTRAALCLYWKSLDRQIRIEGSVRPVSPEEADAYFASRARSSQIGAWASEQSRPLLSRSVLEERTRAVESQYPGEVPRPAHWTGYLLEPDSIEFWQNRPHRLHDRVVFTRTLTGGTTASTPWSRQRLYP